MKHLGLLVITGALFSLLTMVGCEDTATSSNREAISVKSSDDLQNCNDSEKGVMVLVESTNSMYFCNGKTWVEMHSKDTVYIKADTTIIYDTLVMKDSIKIVAIDTVYSLDTLVVKDTVYSQDTLVIKDSVFHTNLDTIYVKDTVFLSGLDGNSCTMSSEVDTVNIRTGALGYKVFCADTLHTVLWNGVNGNNSQNCTIRSGDAYTVIACGTTEAYVQNYVDPLSTCSLYNNEMSDNVYIVCGSEVYPVYRTMCGSIPYDPTSNYFCSFGMLYQKCDNKEYDPSTHFCMGTLYAKCNGVTYYHPYSAVCINGIALTSGVSDINGNFYGTVSIGLQVWMNRSLQTIPPKGESRCYDDDVDDDYDPPKCSGLTSRLYTWAVAVDTATLMEKYQIECSEKKCNIPDTLMVQGICPDGWHIPSNKEVETLISTVASDKYQAVSKLKSTLYDEGTDDFGFSLLPFGPSSKKQKMHFWTSSPGSYLSIDDREIEGLNYVGIGSVAWSDSKYEAAVRCIRNTNSLQER